MDLYVRPRHAATVSSKQHCIFPLLIGATTFVSLEQGAFGCCHLVLPQCVPRKPADVELQVWMPRASVLPLPWLFLRVLVFRKGEAEISSDSVSAVAILKEVITKQATERKVGCAELCRGFHSHSPPGFAAAIEFVL